MYILTTAGLLIIKNNTYKIINMHSKTDTKSATFLCLYHFNFDLIPIRGLKISGFNIKIFSHDTTFFFLIYNNSVIYILTFEV